jgi:hypothetical protein
MRTRTKWLIGAIVTAAAGVVAAVAGWFALEAVPAANLLLPTYSLEQTDSAHRWYRRTTVHFKSATYVNDFEDYSIWLVNPVPSHAVGRSSFGNSLVCTIPGQAVTDYIAVDCGSEMEAYEVFRNVGHPPFDWRHAKFEAMDLAGTMIHPDHIRTTDSTLIDDAVRTLRDGTPVSVSLPASTNSTNLARLSLYSDALPGLRFCPAVYIDSAGSAFLAQSHAVEYANRAETIHAEWVAAGGALAQWLRSHEATDHASPSR